MNSEIRVDPAFLGDLESRYRAIAASLREVKNQPDSLSEAPPVENAYRDFQSRWDWTRDQFATAADSFADAIGKTSASFSEADAAIAATLQEQQ